MTEKLEYNKILEGADYEGAIHLLLNFKYTLIVVEPVYPILNTPHSTIIVFC